ncbi:MAG: hypothetical protein Q8R34_02245 [bacterium]|nr:hypothetical protein [bacterium]
MSRIFLALVSLAAITILSILLVRASDQRDSGVDDAIARAEKILGLANTQTDRTIAAARQLADRPQPRPVPAPSIAPSFTIRVAVDPPPVTVVVQQPPPVRNSEDQFKDWLRSRGIW